MQGELGDLVHRVARKLRRGYGERLGPLGLSPGQARALRVIADADGGAGPLRMVQLADELRIAPRSVTPVVDALEEAGLVRRETDPANRRSTLLVVTPAGAEVHARVREARRAVAEELFSVLDPGQRATLEGLLGAVDRSGFGAGRGRVGAPTQGSGSLREVGSVAHDADGRESGLDAAKEDIEGKAKEFLGAVTRNDALVQEGEALQEAAEEKKRESDR